MSIDDDAQSTNNVDAPGHFNVLCGVPALEDPIANNLVALGFQQHRATTVTLLIDLPPGFALHTLETTERVNRYVVVVTWNICPAYLEDLWDRGPDVLLAGRNLGQELANAIAHAEQGKRYWGTPGGTSGLTERERRLLYAVAHNWNNQHIAKSLGIAEKTVKNRLTDLYQKLGLADRLAAALYYWGREDLLEPEQPE
jgi:DNA-binding NarL/FixJ family response regulator